MKWYVGCKESFEERQKYIQELMEIKRIKKEQLEFEIALLQFTYDGLRNNGWK